LPADAPFVGFAARDMSAFSCTRRLPVPALGKADHMLFILWLIAVVLVIWGIVSLARGEALLGVLLIVVGLLVGPGGVSAFA
jgi:hypothetical protein